MSITKTFSRNMGRLAIDPNQNGLVAGYDMVPNGVTLPDKTVLGNDGTIFGPAFEFTSIGPSMKLVGAGELLTTMYTDAPAAFTVSGWYNLRSSGQGTFGRLFSKGTDILELFVNNSPTDLNLRYENGSGVQNSVISGGYAPNLACHIAITYAAGSIKVYLNSILIDTIADSIVLDASALVIGNLSVNASDGNISNFKIFNRAITPAEIQAEYQAGARAINWKSDYGVDVSIAAESTPGELSNSVARIESGTHEMTTDTIHEKTCNAIECVTPGIVQVPIIYYLHGDETQAAYGTFEWWVKKVGGLSNLNIGFISDEPLEIADAASNGYGVIFSSSERVQLVRMTGASLASLSITDIGYAPINTWLKFKVTRSLNGEFALYLNDTLVNVSGGANPVTDTTFTISKYLVLDLDAGDKVAWAAPNGECAIVKYQGVV